MKEKSLKEVAVTSMFWTALQKYVLLGVTFISSIVLARLLTPYDYGCIGMLEIFITIATIMIEGGFGSALLQKKMPSEEDYSTVFYWNLFLSAFFYLVLFFSAPAIARFYNIPILSNVLRIQGLVLFVNAFKMIPSNKLRKNFRFRPIAIVNVVSSVFSVSVAIVMAYRGYGVWALVAQYFLIAFLPMIAFWFITKWKPLWNFSKKSFMGLFRFGGFMLLTDLVNTISSNIQGLLIGRVYTPATMGYYSKAKTTEGIAASGISQVVSTVSYQLYAEVQDDFTALTNILRRITSAIAFLTIPLIITLILTAEPIFIILYSDRWLPCVPYFRVLAFASFPICLQAVNLQSIAAIGRSKSMFSWTLIKRLLDIVLIVGGLMLYGINGLLYGMVISAWMAFFINSWLVSKHIGYKLNKQFLNLLPIVLLSIITIIPSLLYHLVFSFNIYLDAIIESGLFLSLYIGGSVVMKLDAYSYCKDTVHSIINKRRHK